MLGALGFLLVCGFIATRLGSEFIPNLNEGDMAIQALRIPGTSLTQSVAMQVQLETRLKEKFPEIERVFARTGTAEIASDAMPPNISDGYIMLKPEKDWPTPKKSHADLREAIQREAQNIPGNNYEFSQPIQLRFNELISGVRSDVAVKIFGDDNDVLNKTAAEVAEVLQKIPGASEVKVEQTTGLPMLSVSIDRAKAARYGLSLSDIQDTLTIAAGGREAGTFFQGDRRSRYRRSTSRKGPREHHCTQKSPGLRCREVRGRFRPPTYHYLKLRHLIWRLVPTRSPARMESGGLWSAPTFAAETLDHSSARRKRQSLNRSRSRPVTGQHSGALSNNLNRLLSDCRLWSPSPCFWCSYCCSRCLETLGMAYSSLPVFPSR